MFKFFKNEFSKNQKGLQPFQIRTLEKVGFHYEEITGVEVIQGINKLRFKDNILIIEGTQEKIEIVNISSYIGVVTIEKIVKKSSLGRAVLGGVALGGVGAIVGATSGIGSKNKKVNKIKSSFVIHTTDERKICIVVDDINIATIINKYFEIDYEKVK